MIRFLLGVLVLRRADAADADPRAVALARSVTVGALVGAAIAGSSFWWGRRDRDA
jgi:N-acetylglutamate synthase/N-acetylornithine aminotransferase